MKVVIVGSGVWGKALFSVISQNTPDVSFSEKGKPISADIVVLALPTHAIRDVLSLVVQKENCIIMNTSKGIEESTHLFPYQIVAELLPHVQYITLMGPSFAEEVIQKMPTRVNLGYTSETDRHMVQKLFQTTYFYVQPTQCLKALEIAGALKNVYAIAAGIADGLGFKANTRSQLIVMAVSEIQNLCNALDFLVDTSVYPGLIGDLILTCTPGSRNYNFGKLLATHTTQQALEQINSTVEGQETAGSIGYLEEKTKIKLPLAHFVQEVLQENNPQAILQKFTKLLNSL